MDPNVKSSMTISAIDSSVSSLAFPFGQADMNPVITGGPINRLPDEMMQLIMAKLDLDGDVKKLVPLRLVSPKWKAVVDDYCRLKKSLAVFMDQKLKDINFLQLKEQFFGFLDLKILSRLYLRVEMSSKSLRSLLKMFSNIVQLSICCDDYSKVPYLTVYINSLESLKQLDLKGPFVAALPYLSPTLDKLEHFSIDPPYICEGSSLKDEDHLQLVSNLGPTCVRVHFTENLLLNHGPILQWHKINPHWLANLTHLQMSPFGEDDEDEEDDANRIFAQVIHFLSEHTPSLKVLNLGACGSPYQLTTTVIDDLAKLSHLTELELTLQMSICKLTQAAAQHRLTSLYSVSTLELYVIDCGEPPITADNLTRVLSIIFPNLVHLMLTLERNDDDEIELPEIAEVEDYLDRFNNLVQHVIYLS